MPKRSVTIATWDYDRVRPLMDARVVVEGCYINYLALLLQTLRSDVVRFGKLVTAIGIQPE